MQVAPLSVTNDFFAEQRAKNDKQNRQKYELLPWEIVDIKQNAHKSVPSLKRKTFLNLNHAMDNR